MAQAELDLLDFVSEHTGQSRSEIVRNLIHEYGEKELVRVQAELERRGARPST